MKKISIRIQITTTPNQNTSDNKIQKSFKKGKTTSIFLHNHLKQVLNQTVQDP